MSEIYCENCIVLAVSFGSILIIFVSISSNTKFESYTWLLFICFWKYPLCYDLVAHNSAAFIARKQHTFRAKCNITIACEKKTIPINKLTQILLIFQTIRYLHQMWWQSVSQLRSLWRFLLFRRMSIERLVEAQTKLFPDAVSSYA